CNPRDLRVLEEREFDALVLVSFGGLQVSPETRHSLVRQEFGIPAMLTPNTRSARDFAFLFFLFLSERTEKALDLIAKKSGNVIFWETKYPKLVEGFRGFSLTAPQ